VSRLRLTVADDGPGIPGPDRDRLFFRFERLAGSVGSDGSGLGLYVSRELCRAMGGDLVLEPTAPAGGATFAVIVPAEPPEPPGEA
jgi:signal transduction histidine kinase